MVDPNADSKEKNIIKKLKDFRKLLENKNYGDQIPLWDLVNILIKYFEERRKGHEQT